MHCLWCAGYEGLTGKLVKLLERLKNREVSPDYTYYGIASPWLQVQTSPPVHGQATTHISLLRLDAPARLVWRLSTCRIMSSLYICAEHNACMSSEILLATHACIALCAVLSDDC